MSSLVLALPSKGRLKEQCEAWLAEAGLAIEMSGGARGYRATLVGAPDIQIQYLSAGAIAGALDAGEVHMGVTGEDLQRGFDADELPGSGWGNTLADALAEAGYTLA